MGRQLVSDYANKIFYFRRLIRFYLDFNGWLSIIKKIGKYSTLTTRFFMQISKNKPKFLAVDFFCGAGGTTRGIIDAGGYVIAGIDKSVECKETYINNNKNEYLDKKYPQFLGLDIFPNTDDYPDGQQEKIFDELNVLLAEYSDIESDIPLMFAICAPCQPFTKLSKKELSPARKEARKRDSSLLKEALKFVDLFHPEIILSENVPGIKDKKYGGIWDEYILSLMELGYAVGSKIICCSKFGIPQHRKRTVLIAAKSDQVKKERFADLYESQLLVPEVDSDSPMISVKDAIDHLPVIEAGDTHPEIPNHKTRSLNEINLKRLSCAKPGESNAYLENTPYGDLSLPCHRRVNKKMKQRCFSDVYTRMSPNRPSPTITTKCQSISNGRFGHYDTSQVRGISLREAAMLQSFKENYVFYPIDRLQPVASMIGNAVPPKLACFFSKYLVNSIENSKI